MNRSVLILPLALAACVLSPEPERGSSAVQQGFADGQSVVDLNADPRFVLRMRLDADHPSVQDMHFGHRSRQWHVYPMTLYPRVEAKIAIHVDDGRMADRTAVWLFGPMRGDGSWGEPKQVTTVAGAAELTVRPKTFGQYAVVVGPQSRHDFLPRYPGRYGLVQDPADPQRSPAQFPVDDARAPEIYVNDGTPNGTTYTILDPLPKNEAAGDAVPGAIFHVQATDGTTKTLQLVSWTSIDNYVREDATDVTASSLGMLEEGVLTLDFDDPSASERFLVIEGIGSDGTPSRDLSTNPVLLRVVPEVSGGRKIILKETPNCGSFRCVVAVYEDNRRAVEDDLIVAVKPAALDFEEPSTYDITVQFRSDPSQAAAVGKAFDAVAPMTRYPVYFAHGVNSSEETWSDVLDELRTRDSRWETWATAGSVPGYEPIAPRAEHLRRNLTAFLAGFSPPAGEPYMRLNVVAHSMGGLDTRYLIGNAQYNEHCAELLCTTESGEREACCPSDASGHPVMWRDCIASLTTLSTPHAGSGFADWGRELLSHGVVDWTLEQVVTHFLHLDLSQPDGYDKLKDTMVSLSRQYAEEETIPRLPLLNRGRGYSWGCATGEESCASQNIASADRPRADGDGFLLPGPNALPTIFSWAGVSCTTGNCGDILDPALLLPHNKESKLNDGVVSIASAQFGIYMGVRPNDHFHWTRVTHSHLTSFASHLFGLQQEPIVDWHQYWLGELARAGY